MSTRLATKGNGTNLYGTIPTWTATNWEIEFDVVFPTTLASTTQLFLDSNNETDRRYFFLGPTGNMRFFGGQTCTVDGVAITTDTVPHPVDGAVHHVKMAATGLVVKIGKILSKFNVTLPILNGSIFNLRLTDLTTSANSRFYPMDEDSTTSTFIDTVGTSNGTWYNRTEANLISVGLAVPAESSLGDIQKWILENKGFVGSLPDMKMQFLKEYFPGDFSLNDLQYKYLVSLGYSGSLVDMKAAYLRSLNA